MKFEAAPVPVVRWRSTKKVITTTIRTEPLHEEYYGNEEEKQEDTPPGAGSGRHPGGVRVGIDVETKIACIQALIPLGLLHVQAVLEEEVCTLAGARYTRKSPQMPGCRHGSNPGSIRLAGKHVSLRIPRAREATGEEEIPLTTLPQLCQQGALDEVLLNRVLYEISCRNYEAAAGAVPGAIGLSSPTVSRRFIQGSAKHLQMLQERDLQALDLVAVFLDGKTFADMTMVIAVGITHSRGRNTCWALWKQGQKMRRC